MKPTPFLLLASIACATSTQTVPTELDPFDGRTWATQEFDLLPDQSYHWCEDLITDQGFDADTRCGQCFELAEGGQYKRTWWTYDDPSDGSNDTVTGQWESNGSWDQNSEFVYMVNGSAWNVIPLREAASFYVDTIGLVYPCPLE